MARLDMETMKIVLEKNNINTNFDCIYDVGCLNGTDSILLSELFNCEVVGIEGLEENYEKFLSNNKNKNLRFYNKVIREYDGTTIFYQKEKNGIHSIYEQNLSKTLTIHKVQCQRLDTFIKEHNEKIPDLIKIDVEGATLEVLQSLGNILQEIKILQIETEELEYFNGQRLEHEVLDFLSRLGFVSIFKSSSINVKQNDYIMINENIIKL